MMYTGRNKGNGAVSPADLADKLGFGDVQWSGQGDSLLWLESRSDRAVIVTGRTSGRGARDITREESVRAGVGYGGGDFSCAGDTVYFISGRKLYRQKLEEVSPSVLYRSDGDLSAPSCSPFGEWIVFIESFDDSERLAAVSSSRGQVVDIHTESDFNMQAAWHPSGKYLAWVTWENPCMPWNRSSIRIIEFGGRGPEGKASVLEEEIDSSVFQPEFSPDGRYLAYVTDRNGWANLRILEFPSLECIAEAADDSEHAVPAWLQGMRTIAWAPDSRSVFLIRNAKGFSSLARYWIENGKLEPVQGLIEAYSSMSQIAVSKEGRIAVIASSPSVPPVILVSDETGGTEIWRISLPGDFVHDPSRNPEPLSWDSSLLSGKDGSREKSMENGEGFDNESGDAICNGLFYRPLPESPDSESKEAAVPPPVVIMIHGGPTSCHYAEFDPAVLFYTSRGYAVMDLNYRGSTGYGREYRCLLNEKWGVYDVQDVKGAADFLISRGLADSRRIFLDGGSAGGFTLLLSLINYPGFFRGGICRYGVADLFSLVEDTHRFEAHYLDSLIGKLPDHRDRYQQRSPIDRIKKLVDPVAVFQGSDDKVVPLNQAEKIVASLEQRKVPHLFHVFEGEGHGWRKKETIKAYYEMVEDFLLEYCE